MQLEAEKAAQSSSRGAELARDSYLSGGDAWVPGRRLAKQAAHHRPLLPGHPRKPAGVGKGWGNSGIGSPSPQRPEGGRKGGSWGDNPLPLLPLWAQPPNLTSPTSAGDRTSPNPVAPLAPTPRPRQRQPPATTAAAAWLGRGPAPQAPHPTEVGAGRGWEEVGGG